MDKREVYLVIQTKDGAKEIRNAAIRGRVTRKMSENASTANISIANLTKDDIEYLTTYMSPYVDQSNRKRISIFAGYENTGVGQIFSGDIYTALPEGMPDTWLNIEAKTNYYNQQDIITYTSQNTTVKQFALNAANEMNLQLSWQSKSQKLIDAINFTGAKAELINQLNKLENIYAYIDNEILKVVDKDAEPPSTSSGNEQQSGTSATKQPGYIKRLSPQSGLIGIPQPDEYGLKAKALLDPTMNIGDWVEITSDLLPIINGQYQIYELTFDFASREPQFYVEIAGKNKVA